MTEQQLSEMAEQARESYRLKEAGPYPDSYYSERQPSFPDPATCAEHLVHWENGWSRPGNITRMALDRMTRRRLSAMAA